MVARLILWVVAAFYAYGAIVHVLNIMSLSGFDWTRAPLKWQILDVVYLLLNVVVVIGFVAGLRIGYLAFFIAAGSQILLYTVFRAWIVDVPEEFMRSPEDISHLNGLVMFHVLTVALVALAWWLERASVAGHE